MNNLLPFSSKLHKAITWMCSAVLIFSCQETPHAKTNENSSKSSQYYAFIADSITPHLTDGMIAVRLGNDITSEIFRKMSQTDASYSHIGIIFKDSTDNQFKVYHAIGGETNPNSKLRYEKIDKFFDADENLSIAIYTIESVVSLKKLHHYCDSIYHEEIPFDMKFDLATDDKMYCAEFLYKALKKASPNLIINHSYLNELDYIAIDNFILNPKFKKVYSHDYQNLNAIKSR